MSFQMEHLCVFIAVILHTGLCCWTSSGLEFITAFTDNDGLGSDTDFQLKITAMNPGTSVKIIVTNTLFKTDLLFSEKDTKVIEIPTSVGLLGVTKSPNSAILVTADKPVTVFSLNYRPTSAGCTTVFPVETLGTVYYAFSPKGSHGLPQIAVINTDQNNMIMITLTGSVIYNNVVYNTGDTLTVELLPFEVIQLQSLYSLTGTRISSKYPIAVLSGNNCISYDTTYDIVFEQMVPVNLWGTIFLISALSVQDNSDIITIVAAETTDIVITTKTKSKNVVLSASEHFEISLIPSTSLSINATKGVMVMHTCTGSSSYSPDSFIMNILPLEAFCNSYIINPDILLQTYIHIIAKSSLLSEILLDNLNLPAEIQSYNISGTEYSWIDIPLSSAHRLYNVAHKCSAFGLYIYGGIVYIGTGTTALGMKDLYFDEDIHIIETSLNNGSFLVQWNTSSCFDGYNLQIWKSGSLSPFEEMNTTDSPALFSGRYFHAVYNLTIWALSSDLGLYSWVTQFNHPGVLDFIPSNVSIASLYNGSVLVQWINPDIAQGNILQLCKSDSTNPLEEQAVNSTLVVFKGPYFKSLYNLTVWAVSVDGKGLPLTTQFSHSGVRLKLIHGLARVDSTASLSLNKLEVAKLIQDQLQNKVQSQIQHAEDVTVRVLPAI